jgi:hypothetical protein
MKASDPRLEFRYRERDIVVSEVAVQVVYVQIVPVTVSSCR